METIDLEEILNIQPTQKTAVIDGDFLLYYCTYPFKIVHEDNSIEYVPKTLVEVQRAANEFITDILTRLDTCKYIGYLGGYTNFRYGIYPDYKASRKSKPKPEHFQKLKDHLSTYWSFTFVDGCEVDDAVVSYTHRHSNTIIVSPDKDLLMTTGNHYNPIKREMISTTATAAHEYFWKSMIIGDNADGIKGIPGKGAVYATRMWDKYMMKLSYLAPAAILELYVDNYGEEQGVAEYYKNYKLLKISTSYYIDCDIQHYSEGAIENKYDHRKSNTGKEHII